MKKFCVLMGLAGILFSTTNVAYAKQISEQGLEGDIFGKTRILLLCNTGIDDPVERVLPEMNWQGFVERDIVIVTIGPRGVEILNTDGTRNFPSANSLTQIHQSKNCRRGVDFNLIGKDGGVKKLWSGVVWSEDLFAAIDAMPMRQYEMRQKERQN